MQLWNKTLKFYFTNSKVTKKHLPRQLQNHLYLKQIPRDPLFILLVMHSKLKIDLL